MKYMEWIDISSLTGDAVVSIEAYGAKLSDYKAWVFYVNGKVAMQLREKSNVKPKQYHMYVFSTFRGSTYIEQYQQEKLVATNEQDAKREAEARLLVYQIGDCL